MNMVELMNKLEPFRGKVAYLKLFMYSDRNFHGKEYFGKLTLEERLDAGTTLVFMDAVFVIRLPDFEVFDIEITEVEERV